VHEFVEARISLGASLHVYVIYGIRFGFAVAKTLIVLSGEIKTPPLSKQARIEAGVLLRRLQNGEALTMPLSRPMPAIGPRCHELRIADPATRQTWRIFYRADSAEILVVDVLSKKTQQTPRRVIDTCVRRLREWDSE